jgi:hypothetical protein
MRFKHGTRNIHFKRTNNVSPRFQKSSHSELKPSHLFSLENVVFNIEVTEKPNQHDHIRNLEIGKIRSVAWRQHSYDVMPENHGKLSQLNDCNDRFRFPRDVFDAFERRSEVVGIHNDMDGRVDDCGKEIHESWKGEVEGEFSGIDGKLTVVVFGEDPYDHSRADVVVNMQKRNLILLLPQHEHDCFGKLSQPQQEKHPLRPLVSQQRFITWGHFQALPHHVHWESVLKAGVNETTACDNLKDVVNPRKDRQIFWFFVSHELWANFQHDTKIHRQNQP